MPLCLQCFRLNSSYCVIFLVFKFPFIWGSQGSAEALSWDPGLRGFCICRVSAGDCAAACGIAKGLGGRVGPSPGPKT